MFGLSSSMGFGGYMETAFNPVIVILFGSLIMNLGVIATSFTCKHMLSCLTYGFICGLGAGMIYSVCLDVTSKLFDRFNGLIFGIMVSGFSFGPILINLISKHLVKEDPSQIFLICALTYLGIHWIGVIFIWISNKKENNNIQISNFAEDVRGITNIDDMTHIAPHNMITDFYFWIIWIIFALNSFGTILIIQLHKISEEMLNNKYQLITHKQPEYLNSYLSFLGRIAWGALASFLPPKVVFMFLCFGSSVIYLISAILFPYSYQVMVSICCCWLSGNFSIVPLLVLKRFGPKYFAANFGTMWTSYSCAGILTSALYEYIVPNLRDTMYGFCAMSIFSFFLHLFIEINRDNPIKEF